VNQEYADIVSRLGPPLWWDERGVPRYAPFQPWMCNNVYAVEVCLLEIRCQECGRHFLVARAWDEWLGEVYGLPRVSVEIESGQLHWGDPPYHNCAGDSENCEDLKVLAFWRKDGLDWRRDRSLEGRLEERWLGEGDRGCGAQSRGACESDEHAAP